MSNQTLLVVEDEAPIREMLRYTLTREGYDVIEAADTHQARVAIIENRPDLILLDWMLPNESGIDLLRQLRSEDSSRHIPVVMLTARIEEENKVRGLDVGADDYVTKPFSPKELIARIKAVLRRGQLQEVEEALEVEGLRLEPTSHRVSANNHLIEMGPTEFKLLLFFMTHQERVFSRSQLLDRVWGSNVYIEERTVDVHIRRLRKALAAQRRDHLIQTVRGAGYRFSKRG